jgi:hypothetical protein
MLFLGKELMQKIDSEITDISNETYQKFIYTTLSEKNKCEGEVANI